MTDELKGLADWLPWSPDGYPNVLTDNINVKGTSYNQTWTVCNPPEEGSDKLTSETLILPTNDQIHMLLKKAYDDATMNLFGISRQIPHSFYKSHSSYSPPYVDTWAEDHKNDYKFSVPFLGGQYKIDVDMFEKQSSISWNSCDMHNYRDECEYCNDDDPHIETLYVNGIIDKDVTLEEIRLYLTFS